MSEGTFLIDCPCCKARIEVDRKTGKVVKHWEKPKVKEGGDLMAESLKKLQADKARLDDYFNNAGRSMEEKKKELEAQFEKEKKRIEDSGDTSKPINPMDLD
jgi:enoyl reductase-like protein